MTGCNSLSNHCFLWSCRSKSPWCRPAWVTTPARNQPGLPTLPMSARARSLLHNSASYSPSLCHPIQNYSLSLIQLPTSLFTESVYSDEVDKVLGKTAHPRDRWPGFSAQLCHSWDIRSWLSYCTSWGPQSPTSLWPLWMTRLASASSCSFKNS